MYRSYIAKEDYKTVARERGITLNSDRVALTIYLDTAPEQMQNTIQSLGVEIKATNDQFKVIEGLVPLAKLEELENTPHVKGLLRTQGNNTDTLK